jgi:hypothetical protein
MRMKALQAMVNTTADPKMAHHVDPWSAFLQVIHRQGRFCAIFLAKFAPRPLYPLIQGILQTSPAWKCWIPVTAGAMPRNMKASSTCQRATDELVSLTSELIDAALGLRHLLPRENAG